MSTEPELAGSSGGKRRPPVAPERARRLLERLGPIFVKFGRHLALCPDLLPRQYCEEFLTLTDRVAPFSFEEARQVIAGDLGSPVEELFAWVNPRPVVAGLLTQVHAARTKRGREVIIKIQRPGIRDGVEGDLRREHVFRRILQMAQPVPSVRPGDVLEEFKRRIHEELDLGLELRSLSTMSESAANDGRWRVPRPYPGLSGSRVLTMALLPGVPLSEVLALRRGSPARLASLRIDPDQVARNLLYAMLDHALQRDLFQANLLPDNVVVQSGNVVGFVDFSRTDSLDPQLRRGMIRCLAAIGEEDVDRAFDAFAELVVASEHGDLSRLRADFYEESTRSLGGGRRGDGEDALTSRYVLALLHAAHRNGFAVPLAVLSLFRALVTAENLAGQMETPVDVATVGKPLFGRLQLLAMLDAFLPSTLQPALIDGIQLMSDGPRNLRRLLTDLVDGRLVIRVRTVESDEDRHQANIRARLVATATVSVGVAVLLGAADGALVFGLFPLSWLLWTLLILVWGWIVIQWRDLE